jgi:hypothetical protein
VIGSPSYPVFYAQRQEATGQELNTHAQWRHVFLALQGRAGFHTGLAVKVYQGHAGKLEGPWPEHLQLAWSPDKPVLGIYYLPYSIEFLKIEVSFDGGFPEVYFVRLLDSAEPDMQASLRFTAGGNSYLPGGRTNATLAKRATG